MRRMSSIVALPAVLTLIAASSTHAQLRTTTSLRVARSEAKPLLQQPAATTTGPSWSIAGGLASGDGAYDLGFGVGASARWRRSDWPVAIRGDAYFAHHTGDVGTLLGGFDVSLNLFGILGNAEYSFPTESTLKPYVFGGVGLFYANTDIDYDGANLDDSDYDSSTDLGFNAGGGVLFTPRFGVEIRLMDAGGFTTIPVFAVFRF
jgi:opacity protein-like surface antigen